MQNNDKIKKLLPNLEAPVVRVHPGVNNQEELTEEVLTGNGAFGGAAPSICGHITYLSDDGE